MQTGSAIIDYSTHTVNIEVTYGSTLSSLSPNITISAGAVISSAAGESVDFSMGPVTYTVTAEDASTQNYTVTVIRALNDSKDITSFAFTALANSGVLSSDVTADIGGTNISVTLPYDTVDVTSLAATFTTTGETVIVEGIDQESGITSNDFTNDVIYTVTTEDGSTQDYMVTVIIEDPSTEKEITAFSFNQSDNTIYLDANVVGYIAGNTITAIVPDYTNITALAATFTATGETVTVEGIDQESGITSLDFTNYIIYTVTAEDSSTQVYTMKVFFETTFTSTWDTTHTSDGSSADNQIKLPLEEDGTYDFRVYWGDGNSDTITSWDQTEVTHTYTAGGTYTMYITGTIIGWRFNNTGDKLKLTGIEKWGVLILVPKS